MTHDVTKLTDDELVALALRWVNQLNYSLGNHWPLRVIGGGDVPAAADVFTEVARRLKEKQ